MRVRVARSLAVLLVLSGACGGRLIRSEGDEGTGGAASGGGTRSVSGGSSNNGATSSQGATSSKGGGVAVGGTTSIGGKPPVGGAFGTAGASSMGGACACPAIACGPGTQPVPNPDGCCFHCESICQNVMCPGIACGSGSHPEMIAGQCCPICIQDSCATQRATYFQLRQQLVDKYSTLGCASDADCTIYYEKNQCYIGCGIAIPAGALGNLDSNLQSFAQTTCSPNCPLDVPPCVPAEAPHCVDHRCY